MSKFGNLCDKYFGCTGFYDILGISTSATEKEVRKAYHKLSLKVHPDRVSENLKEEATEKFKVLSRIYYVLNNEEKRRIYDQTGTIDDEDSEIFEDSDFDWLNYWKRIFKPVSEQDIRDYENKYKGSEEEEMDLKKAYVNGKGSMDFILENVPFSVIEEEPRYKSIIQKYIDSGEVPIFDKFINEPPRNAARRKRKYQREAELSERIASTIDKDETGEDALRQLIQSKNRDRGEAMNSFFDHLAAKYGGKETNSPEGRQTRRRSKK